MTNAGKDPCQDGTDGTEASAVLPGLRSPAIEQWHGVELASFVEPCRLELAPLLSSKDF